MNGDRLFEVHSLSQSHAGVEGNTRVSIEGGTPSSASTPPDLPRGDLGAKPPRTDGRREVFTTRIFRIPRRRRKGRDIFVDAAAATKSIPAYRLRKRANLARVAIVRCMIPLPPRI